MIAWVLCPACSQKNALKIFRAAALVSVNNENKGDVTGCRATESKDWHCARGKFPMMFSCPQYNLSSLYSGEVFRKKCQLGGHYNVMCSLSWSDTVSSVHCPRCQWSSGLSPTWSWLARLLAGLCSC